LGDISSECIRKTTVSDRSFRMLQWLRFFPQLNTRWSHDEIDDLNLLCYMGVNILELTHATFIDMKSRSGHSNRKRKSDETVPPSKDRKVNHPVDGDTSMYNISNSNSNRSEKAEEHATSPSQLQ
jgi:hypothetical protein